MLKNLYNCFLRNNLKLNYKYEAPIFFHEKNSIFEGLNTVDTVNTALLHENIENAEIGFYKGVGFFKLGTGYKLDASKSFKTAMELDKDKIYSDAIRMYLNQLK